MVLSVMIRSFQESVLKEKKYKEGNMPDKISVIRTLALI